MITRDGSARIIGSSSVGKVLWYAFRSDRFEEEAIANMAESCIYCLSKDIASNY